MEAMRPALSMRNRPLIVQIHVAPCASVKSLRSCLGLRSAGKGREWVPAKGALDVARPALCGSDNSAPRGPEAMERSAIGSLRGHSACQRFDRGWNTYAPVSAA